MEWKQLFYAQPFFSIFSSCWNIFSEYLLPLSIDLFYMWPLIVLHPDFFRIAWLVSKIYWCKISSPAFHILAIKFITSSRIYSLPYFRAASILYSLLPVQLYIVEWYFWIGCHWYQKLHFINNNNVYLSSTSFLMILKVDYSPSWSLYTGIRTAILGMDIFSYFQNFLNKKSRAPLYLTSTLLRGYTTAFPTLITSSSLIFFCGPFKPMIVSKYLGRNTLFLVFPLLNLSSDTVPSSISPVLLNFFLILNSLLFQLLFGFVFSPKHLYNL